MKSIKPLIKDELYKLIYFTICLLIDYLIIDWQIKIHLGWFFINIIFFIGVYLKSKNINATKLLFLIYTVFLANYMNINGVTISLPSVVLTILVLCLYVFSPHKIKSLLLIKTILILFLFTLMLFFIYTTSLAYTCIILLSCLNFMFFIDKVHTS